MLPVVVVVGALCVALGEVGAEDSIFLGKCCGVNETLNGEATACVPARWPQYNLSAHTNKVWLTAPLNESWLRRWVPPGVPLGVVGNVDTGNMRHSAYYALRVPVRTSGLVKEAKYGDWRPDRVLFGRVAVYRRSPEGVIRRGALYCVDAALDPFPAPFALLLDTFCVDNDDCVETCCRSGHALTEAVDGSWSCAPNRSLSQSSVAALRRAFDPEVPIRQGIWPSLQERDWRKRCPNGLNSTHLLSTDASARALMRRYTDGFFSTTLSCVSYIVRAGGSVELVALHCDVQRRSRAFYWCTRPLSFVSVLLLLAAEASIVSSPRMRRSVHGWALGCHAACLLAFNIMQLAFYLSVSDDVLSKPFSNDSPLTCATFSILIYFLLMAANCWLTALCLNMSTGFEATRLARTGGLVRRFLALSAFAWGIPAVLTLFCVYNVLYSAWEWYYPSLMETRTCFSDLLQRSNGTPGVDGTFTESRKGGSALFYYAPMALLSAVNATCVIKTILRVRFLTRGNSVLRRYAEEHKKKYQGQKETTKSQLRFGNENEQRVRSGSGPKSVSVYIRLLLSAGVLELTAETTAWACSSFANEWTWAYETQVIDNTLSYRAVGYLTDLARAAVVLWLAAPEEGALRAFWRRLRGGGRGLLRSE